MDVREDRVVLALQTAAVAWVTPQDVELAHRISAVVGEFRLTTQAGVGGSGRSVQVLEIGIDAMDIARDQAVLAGGARLRRRAGPGGAAERPGRPGRPGPAVWFQQMDAPRPQRNRIHFDVSVPHDEAHQRIEATVAAGGTLVYDAEAPAFWVLADPEGNEACITTWQGRDG